MRIDNLGFRSSLIIAVLLVTNIFSDAQTTTDKPKVTNSTETSSLLAEIANLPAWFASIIPKLRSQGNELDREKLGDKLTTISKQLAETEQLNLGVVALLQAPDPNYGRLRTELEKIQKSNLSIATAIKGIRSDLHMQGEAETSFERNASDAMNAKGIMVSAMLFRLGYSETQDAATQETLKANSAELVKLIRQTEDAVNNAYQALQSPVLR